MQKFSGSEGAGESVVTGTEESVADGAAEAEELRAGEDGADETAAARRVHPVTEALTQSIACGVGADWERLASRLGFQSDEVGNCHHDGA